MLRPRLLPPVFFALVASLLAQSDPASMVNQTRDLHWSAPRLPQGSSFVQSRTKGLRAAAASGLNFATAAYDSGGFIADSVAVADLNGDGKLDLVVANQCSSAQNNICTVPTGNLGVLLGNGDGTFQTAVAYSSGEPTAYSVAVADVNGDGKPDIVVANSQGTDQGGTVGVLLGNGDGTFQTAVVYESGGIDARSVAIADLNGDGKLDLVVANRCSDNTCVSGSVTVLLGNGDGTFQRFGGGSSGGNFTVWVTVADVNGDGKPDLVAASQCASSTSCGFGSVGVLLGNGDGTFMPTVAYSSGGDTTNSVTVADVNEDGKPDLLVVSQCANSGGCTGTSPGIVGVMLGNGDGTFQAAVNYETGGGTEPFSVAVADVNGDGRPDLALANGNGSVGVLLGNGDGTFQTAEAFASGGFGTTSIVAADVNGDGKPDLLVASCGNGNSGCNNMAGGVGVLINTSLTATKTALVSSLNPSNFGQAVTFTATATAQPGFDKGTPTGTVSFSDGTTQLGSSTLNSSGVATLTISTLAVGTHSITAAYKGDTNFVPSTSAVLSQVVQGAIVQLSATSLNFGNQTVSMTSAAKTVTLTNKGNVALTISSISISGTDIGDFARTTTCPGSLAPSSSCTISVTFKPAATGTRTAAVSITDSAPNSPQKVSLTGVGVQPAVTLSTASLTFPTQVVNTTSKAETVTVKNTGIGILKITNVAVTGPFKQTNSCGVPVNPGKTCTVTVTFTPTSIGVLTGTLSFTDNAPNSPQKVTLKGTGTAIQLTPAALNFGNQPVGTTSLAQTITLSNKSHASVNIIGIGITGIDAGDFHQTHTCGTSVASGASCFIHVTFKPTATGTRTAVVSVSDNSGGSPQKVSLVGTGT